MPKEDIMECLLRFGETLSKANEALLEESLVSEVERSLQSIRNERRKKRGSQMEIEIFDAKRRFKLQVTQDKDESLKSQK